MNRRRFLGATALGSATLLSRCAPGEVPSLDGGFSAGPAAIAGYPDITVPMDFVSGLPVGVSFFGPAWSETKLLAIAYAYEQATRHRKPPELLPTLA